MKNMKNMKNKNILKMIVDIVMLILMLLEYSKIYTGQLIHEIVGIVLSMLFLIHNLLNIKFYKGLLKGKYNLTRIATTVVDFMFLLCMLCIIVLGIPISEKVFKFLNINGNMTIRKLHTIFGYWAEVLLAMHLGLHFKIIFVKLINILKNKNTIKILVYLIEILIVAFGIKIMNETHFGDYLIGNASFAIPTGNIFLSFINNFVIVASIGIIIFNIEKIFLLKKHR